MTMTASTPSPVARQVTIALQGDKSISRYGELARLVEGYGFDGISVYADLGFQPTIAPLLEVARATERLRVGPAGLNPYLLHPIEIAGQIAALDDASQGRAYLGLVRGAWLDGVGIGDDRPLARLRETIAVVRHLLSGREDGYRGEIYQLPVGRLFQYPVRRAEVPLLVGSWGPKMLAIAGELAGEVKIGGSTNPDLVPEIRRRVAVGERRAGRSEGTVGVCFGAVTVVDEDGDRARAWVQREVARYLPVVAPLDPTVEIGAGELRRMADLVDAGRLDDAALLVPDDLQDRFAFSGTPEQVAAQARRLFDAGATRVEFGTPHGLTDEGGIALLGDRVLPALRAG
ncbi:MAG TPA: LLM class flavin-dependent oxidoreductase [Thermomicrobiales bacterium]|jgi:5,10-methylenetetrahydromethanopterin reductase|nr:LLM class flavin-dependent oxidoreductase [Thermomicrobiales bacterium]